MSAIKVIACALLAAALVAGGSGAAAAAPGASFGAVRAGAVGSGAEVAVVAVASVASAGSTTRRWQWPTTPPGALVQTFVAPAGPYAAGHRGIDLAAASGQAVLAPTGAVVEFAGVVVDRPVVTLRVDEHLLVSFEPVATQLPADASVARGEAFGTVAAGGHCDGRCVHVGVRVDGAYVSPLAFFAGVPAAVLLPLD